MSATVSVLDFCLQTPMTSEDMLLDCIVELTLDKDTIHFL